METEILLKYCYTSAERKIETASVLMLSKKYADSLFFCHLALEFILKGKYVEIKKEMFPITHDLENLTRKIGIILSNKQKTDLAEINTFNIAGRYDDYKLSFYKKAKKLYAKKYYAISKKLFIWIKKYPAKEL